MTRISSAANVTHDIPAGCEDYTLAIFVAMAVVADLTAVIVSAVIGSWWRFSLSATIDVIESYSLIQMVSMSTLIVSLWMQKSYVIDNATILSVQIRKVVLAWASSLMLAAAFMFLSKSGDFYSRLWFLVWAFCGTIMLILLRILWRILLRRATRGGLFVRNIVLYGDNRSIQALNEYFSVYRSHFLRVAGAIATSEDLGGEPLGVRILGTNLREALGSLKQIKVSAIIVASEQGLKSITSDIGWQYFEHPVDIVISPPSEHLDVCNVIYYGGLPTFCLAMKPLSGGQVIQKRILDLIVSALCLIALIPLFIIIAVAIKVDSRGPVIFRQERCGYRGTIFKVLKFRTMYNGRPPEHDVPQAQRNDIRVTTVGAVLRRLSLDELPQLINVLVGDMSLVGPRPFALAHHKQYLAITHAYAARHRIKPGMTGWAQVSGRRGMIKDEDALIDRVSYDTFYLNNWSLSFDIEILIRTIFALWGENAY